MQLGSLFVLASALAARAGVLVAAQDDDTLARVLNPTRYIVEFSEAGSAKFRKRDGSLDSDDFIVGLRDAGSDVEPAMTFNSPLFHGASFDLTGATEEDIQEILNLPEVENIWPAAWFTLGEQSESLLTQAEARALLSWDPHRATNVTRIHESGNEGEGIVIGIVDSGIDYRHPALGGGLGPGFKVDGGWNFVGGDMDIIDCMGHGTHVAGIIGSDDPLIRGVAPKATLRAYKVFGCFDGAPEDMIMAAFLRAHEEGADVINASLGGNSGFPSTPIAMLLTRIQAEGTMVVVAAGNSGGQGPFYTTNLGNNFGGFTVGSIEAPDMIAHEVTAFSTSGESRTFVYVSSDSRPFNRPQNVSASWVENTRDYRACSVVFRPPVIPNDNLIVLPRSTLCDWQSLDNTLNNRVDWVFWYQVQGAEYEIPTRRLYDSAVQPVGSALISYEDGDWLVSQREKGHDITYFFDPNAPPRVAERASVAGGKQATSSSWGPTVDGRMKPEVVAPGGNVLSTWTGNGWSLQSGTSMASPYIAGLSALVLKAHGTRAVRDDAAEYARARIIASGRSVEDAYTSGLRAATARQGAGLPDAAKAIEFVTGINPSYLHLNDTDFFKATHDIELTNNGDAQVTYRFSHITEPTYFTRSPDRGNPDPRPASSTEAQYAATAVLPETELVLQPGEVGTVQVKFTEPVAGDVERFPVYGGAIIISSDNGETQRVVYMGIKGSINEYPHWGGDRRPFLNERGEPLTDGGVYSFNNQNVPYFPIMLVWSTRQWSYDFVSRDWTPEDWTWPIVLGENNIVGHVSSIGDGNTFVDVNCPVNRFPRIASQYYLRPRGVMANGQNLPSGEYRILRRSIKTFGSARNIDDWQWDLSPWFKVDRSL